jgi:hypothetical protein
LAQIVQFVSQMAQVLAGVIQVRFDPQVTQVELTADLYSPATQLMQLDGLKRQVPQFELH